MHFDEISRKNATHGDIKSDKKKNSLLTVYFLKHILRIKA